MRTPRKQTGIILGLFLAAVVVNGLFGNVIWAQRPEIGVDYDEIGDPAINLSIQSMRAHQVQWQNFMLYTMNVDTPGFIEIGAFNVSEKGKIRTEPFYRWRGGPVIQTNRDLDFYVDANSRGFFQVLLPLGFGYTRDGRMKLDKNRRLVMIAGQYPVMGEKGEIILPPGTEISVSKSGLIFVDGEEVDRFKVFVFEDRSKFETLNGSIFYLKEEAALLEGPEYYSIRQGFIEQNNVIKALIGDIAMAKNTYEGSAKIFKVYCKGVEFSGPIRKSVSGKRLKN